MLINEYSNKVKEAKTRKRDEGDETVLILRILPFLNQDLGHLGAVRQRLVKLNPIIALNCIKERGRDKALPKCYLLR